MARHIEALTFELTFFKGDETVTPTFTINVDRAVYDDPKDAAIDHVMTVWGALKADGLDGYLPKFRTFRILNVRRLDDLGLS